MAKKEEIKKEEPKVEQPKVEKSKVEQPKEEVKKEEPKLKSKYSIAVTGFYSLGKMFKPRGGNEIDSKTYSKQIPEWLKKGYIR